jgi:replicative DNA helicase
VKADPTEPVDPELEEIRRLKLKHQDAVRQLEQQEQEQLGARGKTPAAAWLEFSDLFDHALALGEQYGTGFPTVDRYTDGGLPRATICTIQGKPGIGKTLVATQIARALGKHCAVACLFADEGLTGARIRIGQQLGLERTRMRRPDDVATKAATRALAESTKFFRFLQPRTATSTIEFLAEDFDRIAPPELPRVWLIDSAQVVKSERSSTEGRRIQVSDVVWRVRELADKYQAIALLVSQVNRGAYSSRDKTKRVDDLAAGAESSAIEYASELILHVDGDPKKKIEIRAPKNRLGYGETFQFACSCDFPSATFHELDAATVEEAERVELEKKRGLDTDAQAKIMLDVIKRNPGLTTGAWEEASGKTRRQVRLDARAKLQADGKVFFEGTKGKSLVWYAGNPARSASDDPEGDE